MRWTILFAFLPQLVFSQSIERNQLSAAAHATTTSFGFVSGSMGQILIPSNDESSTTAGFEQPLPMVQAEVVKQARACADGGLVFLTVTPISGCAEGLEIRLDGEPIDPTALQLSPGNYSLKLSAAHYCPTDVTIEISDADINLNCDLKFYKAVLPNGEPQNAQWTIENIDQERYADNEVVIYNRWADEVWRATGYNNQDVVFDGRTKDGKELSDATYFYVVIAGGERFQGYLELLR